MEEDIEPIPIIDNISSEILKPKKEGRNNVINIFQKNGQKQTSQEKEFSIIESYCLLMEKDKENIRDKKNFETNLTNNSNKINLESGNNESRIEAKQVEDLKDCVNKILNEF